MPTPASPTDLFDLPATVPDSEVDRARAALHAELSLRHHNDQERRIADIVRPHPQLLLEQPGRTAARPTTGTILETALVEHWTSVIQIALESGVRPDDRDAFGGRHMLDKASCRGIAYIQRPEVLQLALRHGADPDCIVTGLLPLTQGSPLIRHYAARLISTPGDDEAFIAHAECIRMLLLAGASQFDPPVADDHTSEGYGLLAMLGCTRVMNDQRGGTAEQRDRIARLMELAIERGASVDYRGGIDGRPMAYELLKGGFSESAALLIDHGATLAYPADLAPIDGVVAQAGDSTIEAVATLGCSPAGCARVREALMRRALAAAEQPVPRNDLRPRLRLV